jgi:hypothetical protein
VKNFNKQYQHSEKSSLTLTHTTQIKTTTDDVGNACPDIGQAHKCEWCVLHGVLVMVVCGLQWASFTENSKNHQWTCNSIWHKASLYYEDLIKAKTKASKIDDAQGMCVPTLHLGNFLKVIFRHLSWSLFVLCELRWDMIFRYVDTVGITYHHFSLDDYVIKSRKDWHSWGCLWSIYFF